MARTRHVQRGTAAACARLGITLLLLMSAAWAQSSNHHVAAKTSASAAKGEASHPNILFVIMDDVGIDQMSIFGYGGPLPPRMPNINNIAIHGIRFRNTWSMPECSPARAAFFTGRWPVRNNIFQAIGANDLNNSQVATWEITPPKLLAAANYDSGLVGKFHLGGPENNKAVYGAPASVGFDDFYGWIGGLPASIDQNAGLLHLKPENPYVCGFVPSAMNKGADSGACYIPTSSDATKCTELSGTNPQGDSVGLQCLTQGGVLVPGKACETAVPDNVNFEKQNAHYVSQLVVNRDGGMEVPDLTDPRGRGFRATIEVNAAIDWINRHKGDANPWMETVSFSIDHTPLQPPPGALLSPETRALLQVIHSGEDCSTLPAVRVLSNAMIEAMDTEFGRLLVQTGLATQDATGHLIYDPSATNTVIVIVGDNGSLAQTVKPPFDPTRAKATAYQTGVWVPLIVSGPVVAKPGRQVDAMVNEVDIFQLFGEIAGLDVKNSVPRPIDSYPMMAYLTNPNQTALRTYNFTQGGLNLQANGAHNGPCVFEGNGTSPAQCSQTPLDKNVCQDNGGTWWGVGATASSTFGGGLHECWEVNQSIWKHDPNLEDYSKNKVSQNPQTAVAVRNQQYKLVNDEWLDYDIDTDGPIRVKSTEFYKVDETPIKPQLDTQDKNLLSGQLTKEQQMNFNILKPRMDAVLSSQPPCPGDGNGDGVVDQNDVMDYFLVTDGWSGSSHYDFNLNGFTNFDDLTIIYDHFGNCPSAK